MLEHKTPGAHHLVRICAFVIELLALASPLPAQAKLLRWHDSLEQAAAVARESGKPLFVVFRCVR